MAFDNRRSIIDSIQINFHAIFFINFVCRKWRQIKSENKSKPPIMALTALQKGDKACLAFDAAFHQDNFFLFEVTEEVLKELQSSEAGYV